MKIITKEALIKAIRESDLEYAGLEEILKEAPGERVALSRTWDDFPYWEVLVWDETYKNYVPILSECAYDWVKEEDREWARSFLSEGVYIHDDDALKAIETDGRL